MRQARESGSPGLRCAEGNRSSGEVPGRAVSAVRCGQVRPGKTLEERGTRREALPGLCERSRQRPAAKNHKAGMKVSTAKWDDSTDSVVRSRYRTLDGRRIPGEDVPAAVTKPDQAVERVTSEERVAAPSCPLFLCAHRSAGSLPMPITAVSFTHLSVSLPFLVGSWCGWAPPGGVARIVVLQGAPTPGPPPGLPGGGPLAKMARCGVGRVGKSGFPDARPGRGRDGIE